MRKVILLLTLFAALSMSAAGTNSLKILVLVDQTGSMADAHVAPPTTTELHALAEAVASAGGDLSFGLITNRPASFLRYHVEPPPPRPVAPTTDNINIFTAANQQSHYRSDLALYTQSEQARKASTAARITLFLEDIARLQLQPASTSTNIVDAIGRASVYFAEPSTPQAAMYLICISDGQESTGRPLHASFPQGLTIIVVHRDTDIGILAQLAPRPLQFENTSSAINYILQGGNTR